MESAREVAMSRLGVVLSHCFVEWGGARVGVEDGVE